MNLGMRAWGVDGGTEKGRLQKKELLWNYENIEYCIINLVSKPIPPNPKIYSEHMSNTTLIH